jgi:dGTPase
MSPEIQDAFDRLRVFLFDAVYTNPVAKGEEGKAKDIVMRLYQYYEKNPDMLPDEYKRILEKEDAARAACDYISGMSDRYCVTTYENLFIPKSWGF